MSEHTPPRFPWRGYWSPRHWPTWLGIGLLWLMARPPYPWALALGRGLGRLSYWLAGRRRRIAQANIRLCFPQLSPEEQERLVRQTMASSGMAVVEATLAWSASKRRLRPLLHIEGMEHLERAREAGRGAILIGGHFAPMLIAGRLLAMELDFNILVKKIRNPLLEAVIRWHRERDYAGIIDAMDLRAMVRHLKRGEVCWYAPDQDLGASRSVFAPFMGVPTATLTTTARLARLSGAPLVPIDYERLPDAKGYLLRIHPALENYPSGDDVADARRVNEFIEEQVRRVPAEYVWVHRRFKTRPEGYPSIYDG